MLIISIDVGITNLAFTICEYKEHLETNCKDFRMCLTSDKLSGFMCLKKMEVLCIGSKKLHTMKILCENLNKEIDSFLESINILPNNTTVLIEQQVNTSYHNIVLSYVLYTLFRTKYKLEENHVLFIGAKRKFDGWKLFFTPPEHKEEIPKKIKETYKERKKHSIDKFIFILTNYLKNDQDQNIGDVVIDDLKGTIGMKLDDISDSFLQIFCIPFQLICPETETETKTRKKKSLNK
jgi:hypothetical protein